MESERLEILEGSWGQGLACGHFAAAGSSLCCGDCTRALGAFRTPSLWLKYASIPAAVFLTLGRTLGAETNAAAPALPPELVTTATTNTPAETDQALRAYLRVQEQLHATLLAVEQARLESSQEARAHSEALAARLDVLERTLADQREQRWQTMQDSNRTMLVLAGSVVGLGIIALTLTVLFHSRGMNRLAEVASGLGSERALLADSAPGDLGQGKLLLGPGSTGQRTRPLLATIHRLERRLQEIEQSAAVSLPLEESDPANEPRSFSGGRNDGMESNSVDHLSALLGKGQVLVSLGQAEAALACYDQALLEAPDSADAHLKKGLALERLKRFSEAIACYDRALELNPSLTQAYLCRGAVLNQQERYAEALECYEKALRSDAKR